MKLIAILRIKDQIDTIDECLAKLSEITDEIIVLDNGSTDGTLEAYGRYPKVVEVLRTVGFDEGRDKRMLHEAAKQRQPDWIVWTDADEVFEKHFTREVAEKYMRSRHNRYTFRMCNFWMDRVHCRYDKHYFLYTLHPQRSMWRNLPSAYFIDKKIHNGDIQGVPGRSVVSLYRLKHYGYSDPRKALKKMNLYTEVDEAKGRDYKSLIHPDLPYKAFRYHEYESRLINLGYICLYKVTCETLWIGLRLWLKLKKLFVR